MDEPCLDVGAGRYFRPDQVYWDENPFGSYRRQLAPDLRRVGGLLDRLGVKPRPDHMDAIEVLKEIAAKFGGVNETLDEEDDRSVYIACWKMLDRALEDGNLKSEEFWELTTRKVINDSRWLLHRPAEVLFEDWPGIAKEFETLVAQSIIPQPSGYAKAMRAAGVADVSERLSTFVVEEANPRDDPICGERITSRLGEIGRILQHETTGAAWEAANDRLASLRTVLTDHLEIKSELQLGRNTYAGEVKAVPAHFDDASEILRTVTEAGEYSWPAIARELARAVAPSESASSVASALHGVLAAASAPDASRLLDDLGFPHFADTDLESARPAITEELGEETEATWPDDTWIGQSAGSGANREGHDEDASDGDSEDKEHAAHAEEPASPETDVPAGKGARTRKGSRNERLRTYVSHTEGEEPEGAAEHRNKVDQAGIQLVVRHEESAGRDPEVKPPGHPGYDIESRSESGDIVRFIEVKSLAGSWDLKGGAMTKTQFKEATRLGESYWLYVVENALSLNAIVWRINDPAGRANQFIFDGGWRELAETDAVISADLRALVQSVVELGAAEPSIGAEVGPEGGGMIGTVAVAWLEQRVAIVVDWDPGREDWLQGNDWDVRLADKWSTEELAEALGL